MVDSILQTGMAIEKATALTKSSIELAEATANFGALKVMFGVFLVLIILLVSIFIYQVFRMTHKVESIHNSMTKINEYFDARSLRTIGRIQAEAIFKRFFDHLSNYIKYHVIKSREENHIFDKPFVQQKVHAGVGNEYSELSTHLSRFLYNGKPLNEFIKMEQIDGVEELMIEQIYISKDLFSINSLEQAVHTHIRALRLDNLNYL